MTSQYKKRNLTALAQVSAGLGLVLATAVAGAADDPLVAGCGLLATGQYAAASAQFTRALEQNPRCAEAHVGWAMALLREGQTEQGLQEFELALSLNPNSPAARLGKAGALALLGRWGLAETEYATLAAAQGPEAAEAAAGEAWARCGQGNYEQAVAGLERCPGAADTVLGAYVRAAAEFAQAPESAGPLGAVAAGADAWIGLGSCLTGPGAAWAGHGAPAVVEAPPLPPPPPAGAQTPLRILAPLEGAALRGRVPLLVAGRVAGAAYVLARVGGRFAGMSDSLAFPEPLDTTTWPGGEQELSVEAYDPGGRTLGRGAVRVTVQAGDLTLAEPPPAGDPWVARELARRLVPQPLPGVAEQLRGEIAWRQDRLPEAQAHLTEAFRTDPYLPRVREELLTVNQALGLPVLQGGARLVRIPTEERAVALTFDDGPHPKLTPFILDQLDRVGAHATFFLVGKQVEMYPDLAREIVARGHEVASHTYSHQDLTSVTQLDVERELAASRAVLAAATGRQAVYFRPPGGNYDGQVARASQLWGFTPVFWTCNICDYYQNPKAHVVAGMMRRIQPGGILLLHNGEDLTIEVLPALLQALQAEGYRMGSVGELSATRIQTVTRGTYGTE
jgi:peptidoglycan/xylan/chitin deacetylase (PgdA/CDA1 family)/Tfp pilus assembly protein PilF